MKKNVYKVLGINPKMMLLFLMIFSFYAKMPVRANDSNPHYAHKLTDSLIKNDYASSVSLLMSKSLLQNSTYGFWKNKGQICDQNGNLRPDVLYLLDSRGFKIHLKRNSFSYELYSFETMPQEDKARDSFSIGLPGKFREPEKIIVKSHRIDIELLGANPNPLVTNDGQSEDYNNYYLAHIPEEGVTYVHHYGKVIYHAIYKNIDLIFYRKTLDGNVKYDFIVHPGGNPDDIKLKIEGAEKLTVTENGILRITTTQGTIEEQKPYCYQTWNTEILSKYALNKNIISFDINKPHYDNTKPLTIDPQILTWGTYYGSTGSDGGIDVGVDANKNIIITGTTGSTTSIATSGAHQVTIGREGSGGLGWDAFIAKFNSSGVRQWGTYYGGTSEDRGYDLAIDQSNNIIITGLTASENAISTSGAHQVTYGGVGDAFLAKFNSNGIRQWGTYYAGTGGAWGQSVAVDRNSNIIMIGTTASTNAIATTGAYQETFSGNQVAFIVKFNSSGVRQWGTYYGDTDCGVGVAVDGSNNIIIIGVTVESNRMASTGAHQEYFGGAGSSSQPWGDAFIAKFNSSGERLWGTYYGGSGDDYGTGIETDENDNIIIGGITRSTNSIATTGAHQETIGGDWDTFIAKFNSNGVRQWSTYYGGSGSDAIGDTWDNGAISVDNNNIFICGSTTSSNAISTSGVYQETFGGGWGDAFITKFNSNGERQWGTYYGGSNQETGYGIALDGNNIIITGCTSSTSAISTSGAHQVTYGGGNYDAFIAKFWFCNGSAITSLKSKTFSNITCPNNINDSIWVKNTGDCDLKMTSSTFSGTHASEFQKISPTSWPQTVLAGDSIRLIIKFTPTGTGTKSAKLNLENNSADNPWVIDLSARKDSIAFNLNSAVGDTLIIDFGTFCPGTTKDTSFTIRNTSTIPTTFNIGNLDSPFNIEGISGTKRKEDKDGILRKDKK